MGPFFTIRDPHDSRRKIWTMFEGNTNSKKESSQKETSPIISKDADKRDMSEKDKVTGKADGARVVIKNDVGDLIGALNNGTIIEIVGNAGNYAGEGMMAGELTIDKNAGDCAGNAMSGGTLFIKGDAESYLGQALRGGTVVVGGSLGDFAGVFMISGAIVVCGNAGRHLGSSMIGGAIYVRGHYKTLEPAVEVQKLTETDRKLLTELAQKFHLDLPLKELKKIGARTDAPIQWP
jgi:glutamate synthase domain-containing protein 3